MLHCAPQIVQLITPTHESNEVYSRVQTLPFSTKTTNKDSKTSALLMLLLHRITNLCLEQFSQTDINKEKFSRGTCLSLSINIYNDLSSQRPSIEITSTIYSKARIHRIAMGNSASVSIAPGRLSILGPRFIHSDFNSVYQIKYPKATPEELDMMFSHAIDVGACEEV
jgi:hypothetical protein